MRRDFTVRKRTILGGLALFIVADVALAAYSLQLSSAPRTPEKVFKQQELMLKVRQADIKDAQKIRSDMPKTQQECDKFEASLFPASSGYSSITAELDGIAKKAGIRLEDVTFKQTQIANRGLTEVGIDVTVTGNYKSVIAFLNGVQRSANVYQVDSLALAGENANLAPANAIKVALHLKTYLRTAA